jgi:microcystin-dependent protein
MSEPFLGEIMIVAFNFAPKGWALCNGQLLPINQNQALFSILGTTYGGNGQTTFALPNFQARVPIHVGQGHTLGESGGQASVTLTGAELPPHTHAVNCSAAPATSQDPGGNVWAAESTGQFSLYRKTPDSTLAASAIGLTGGSQAHENLQPFLGLTFVIALQGIFPSQN